MFIPTSPSTCLPATCDRSVFSPVSSTNKADRNDRAEISMKVALNTKILSLTQAHYG